MNLEYYIARKIHFKKEEAHRFSRPAILIAVVGISLGIAVMLISVMVVTGFKQQVSDKITGFGAHIRVTNFDNNASYESVPIEYSKNFTNKVLELSEVENIRAYATKPGIIKTKTDFQGVVLKGLSADYPSSYFKEYLQDGKMIVVKDSVTTNGVVISRKTANTLNLKLNDPVGVYFFQDKLKVRRFEITGIYETHFTEFDKLFAFVDIKHIQSLNKWGEDEISGYEVRLERLKNVEALTDSVFLLTSETVSNAGTSLKTESIKQLYPQIFSWLALIDTNVWIILILMIVVSGFNMISGVLILILEKARMIGVVKSLGMRNWSIRKVFLYQTLFLSGRGMLWGNLIAIAFYLLQSSTGIIKLEPENYYLSAVPVEFSLAYWGLLNLCSAIAIVLMMLIPSIIISRISPSKVVSFE